MSFVHEELSNEKLSNEKPMTATTQVRTENPAAQSGTAELPEVPLTTEGYSVLHQMMRVRRTAWRGFACGDRAGSCGGSGQNGAEDGGSIGAVFSDRA